MDTFTFYSFSLYCKVRDAVIRLKIKNKINLNKSEDSKNFRSGQIINPVKKEVIHWPAIQHQKSGRPHKTTKVHDDRTMFIVN